MRPSLLKRMVPAALAVALVLACASVAMACPGCKDAIASSDPTHGGLVKGFFWSILFMMGTPYLLLASFCGWMYIKVRRARAEAARSAAPAAQLPMGARRGNPSNARGAAGPPVGGGALPSGG